MPTVLERPEIKTRPPETRPERTPPRPVRSFRWLRWVGWLLAAGAVAAVAIVVVVNLNNDETVAPTTAGSTYATTAAPTPTAPYLSTLEPRVGFGEEATITPASTTRLVEHAPGFIQAPDTAFMEEATVTPGLDISGEPQGGIEFWETF